ncbi:nickel-dependent hydrogenase large subunit [Sesbania bispinosa]|nr:nickel-dependent hydrogenase large subunit [Sesbania bispinosa]
MTNRKKEFIANLQLKLSMKGDGGKVIEAKSNHRLWTGMEVEKEIDGGTHKQE